MFNTLWNSSRHFQDSLITLPHTRPRKAVTGLIETFLTLFDILWSFQDFFSTRWDSFNLFEKFFQICLRLSKIPPDGFKTLRLFEAFSNFSRLFKTYVFGIFWHVQEYLQGASRLVQQAWLQLPEIRFLKASKDSFKTFSTYFNLILIHQNVYLQSTLMFSSYPHNQSISRINFKKSTYSWPVRY